MAENVVMTQEEFASLTPGEVQIIDIRDASSTAYGIIPGAKNIPRRNRLYYTVRGAYSAWRRPRTCVGAA